MINHGEIIDRSGFYMSRGTSLMWYEPALYGSRASYIPPKRFYRHPSAHRDYQIYYGFTPLETAIISDNYPLFYLLVEVAQCPLNLKNKNGFAPLHFAAHYGRTKMLKALLRKGCTLEEKDNKENTPLLLAAREGHKELALWLIVTMKCSLAEKNLAGDTPLHLAARGGHRGLVLGLIDEGECILEEKNLVGDTPLLLAARYGHTEVVKLLVSKGANLGQKDGKGSTLLILAASGNHKILMYWLLEQNEWHLLARNNDGKSIFNVLARPDRNDLFKLVRAKVRALSLEQKDQLLIKAMDNEDLTVENDLALLLNKQIKQFPTHSILPVLLNFYTYQDKRHILLLHPLHPSVQQIIATTEECNNLIRRLNHHEIPPTKQEPPECVVEREIFEVWCAILGSKSIDMTTSFNRLPNSTVNKWRRALTQLAYYFQINLDGAIDNNSAKFLAEHIKQKLEDAKTVRLLHKAAGSQHETAKALFFIHPIMGDDSLYRASKENNLLNSKLDHLNCSAYTLASPLLKLNTEPENFGEYCTLEYQARLAINAMRAVHPQGLYYLCGYSYGGALTLEIARQLLRAGKEVRYLGFIDPQLPQQFQSLTASELKKRLAQHLDYISCTLLALETDKGCFIKAEDITTSSTEQTGIITCAMDYASTKLNTNEFKNHVNCAKLVRIYRTLKANYRAMNAYNCEQTIESDCMPLSKVYVASDRADNLQSHEYFLGDLRQFVRDAVCEFELPRSNHYSIIFEDAVVQLIMHDIREAEDIRLKNQARKLLRQSYQSHAFGQIRLPFGEDKFLVEECEFNIISEELTKNANRHVVVMGEMGLGKSVLARQLILNWGSENSGIWCDKHYVFYLPLREICDETYRHNEPLIPQVLYRQFFKMQGVGLDQVIMLWDKIKVKPEEITFVLDGINEVIDKTKHHEILQLFFNQPSQVLVFTRDYQMNILRRLGFSPDYSRTLQPFDDERVDKFSNNFFKDNDKSNEFLSWLRSDKVNLAASLIEKPVYLALLASFWNSCTNENRQIKFDLLEIIPEMIERTLRRYLEHENTKESVLHLLPKANLKEITQDITDFLRYAAYSMIRDGHKVINPHLMNTFLQAHTHSLVMLTLFKQRLLTDFLLSAYSMIKNGLEMIRPHRANDFLEEHSSAAPTLFKQVLLSGFLSIKTQADFEIDRSFAFGDDIFQLYLACEYAKSLNIIDPIFISKLLTQFDAKLVKLWLLEILSANQLQELIKLPFVNYGINYVRFYCYLFEIALKYPNVKLPGNLVRLLCGLFITKQAEADELDEGSNKSKLDNQTLINYQNEVRILATECPRLMRYLNQNGIHRLGYEEREGLLEFALREKDLQLTQWCLDIDVDPHATEKNFQAMKLAMDNGFSQGVALLQNYRYQSLLLKRYSKEAKNQDTLSLESFEAQLQNEVRKQLSNENEFICERLQVEESIVLEWQTNGISRDFDSGIEQQLNNIDNSRRTSGKTVKEYIDLYEVLPAIENAFNRKAMMKNALLLHKLVSESLRYKLEFWQAYTNLPTNHILRKEINDAMCSMLKGKDMENLEDKQQALCEIIRDKSVKASQALIPLVSHIKCSRSLLEILLSDQPSIILRCLLLQHKTRQFDRKIDDEVIKILNGFLLRQYKIQFKEAYIDALVRKVSIPFLMLKSKGEGKKVLIDVNPVQCAMSVFTISSEATLSVIRCYEGDAVARNSSLFF